MVEKDFKDTIINIKNEIKNTQTQILSDANLRLINLYFKIGKMINDNSKWGDNFADTLELILDFGMQMRLQMVIGQRQSKIIKFI